MPLTHKHPPNSPFSLSVPLAPLPDPHHPHPLPEMPPKRRSALNDDDGEDDDGGSSPHQQKGNVGNGRKGGGDSSDFKKPLLTSQHSTYDTNAEEVAKRTVKVKGGEFQWNDEDRQTLRDRYANSPLRRFLPFTRPSLTRAHLYGTNAIKSTRYTLLTFLPVNLFEQLAPGSSPPTSTSSASPSCRPSPPSPPHRADPPSSSPSSSSSSSPL